MRVSTSPNSEVTAPTTVGRCPFSSGWAAGVASTCACRAMASRIAGSSARAASYRTSSPRVSGDHTTDVTPGSALTASPTPSVCASAGRRTRTRPGMRWTTSRTDAAAVMRSSGHAAPSRRAAAWTRARLVGVRIGIVRVRVCVLDVDLVAVAVRRGEDRLAPGTGLGGDVLERLELLGCDTPRVLEQAHAGGGGLDRERPEHTHERRRQPGGADTKEKRACVTHDESP